MGLEAAVPGPGLVSSVTVAMCRKWGGGGGGGGRWEVGEVGEVGVAELR